MKLSFKAEAAFAASLKFGALWGDEGAGGTVLPETNLTLEDYEFMIQVLGAEYGVASFDVDVDNSIFWKACFDAPIDDTRQRDPKFYLVGREKLKLDLTNYRPIPKSALDLYQNRIPTNSTAALVGTNGVSTCTMALSNLTGGARNMGQANSETASEWKYAFTGNSATGSLAWNWA